MGNGTAMTVSASNGYRGWSSFQVAVRDPLPTLPSALVMHSALCIQQEEKVVFFYSESHLMCFRGLLCAEMKYELNYILYTSSTG